MPASGRASANARRLYVWLLIAAMTIALFTTFAVKGWLSWRVLSDEKYLAVLFLALFAAAYAAQIRVQVQRQTFSWPIIEIPLVLGLFYTEPMTLLVARVTAAAMINFRRRGPLQKSVFNVVNAGVEVAVAVWIAQALRLGEHDQLSSWLAAYAAVGASVFVGAVCVFGAIALVQGMLSSADVSRLALSTLGSVILNTTIGLVILLALSVNVWSVLLVLLLVGTVLLGYRTYIQFVRQHQRLAELYKLTHDVGLARQEGTLVDVLLTRTRELLNADAATLWVPAAGRYPELLLTARADDSGLLDQPTTPDVLRRWAIESGRTVAAGPKLGNEEARSVLRDSGVKDAIVVPLRSGTAVIGCLEVADRLGDLQRFGPDDVQLLQTLAAHAAVAVENSRLVDRLRFDAYHDALTGLPNRRRMLSATDEAVKIHAPGDVVAVLLFDVDGLRDVNDSLGHVAGDKLLAEVARRLGALAPPSALVTRVGGDEFAVLLRIENAEGAFELGTRLRAALQAPFTLGTLTIDVDTAVGIAVHPDHGTEPETLLQRADLATYAAKSTSSAVQLFNLGLESRSVRRLGLAGDLRRALDADEIEVYFQPKVALSDRQLVGVECLVRWEHPAHGSVAPEDFVTVAEHTGQLGRLTEVVLRAGLRRCRQWSDDGRPLGVAVNLSPRTLVDPDFPTRVETLIREYEVAPDQLTLEITEDGVLGETDKPLPTLRRLHDIGVRLSVDDFGTGYSSLSYLRRLPVHEVKVDRTFVQGMATDPGDLAIVRAVVGLSRHFGLAVVAEGVESELTLTLLEDMGCDIGQGFFFSRPLPYERLEAWFAAQTELELTPSGEVRRLRAVQ